MHFTINSSNNPVITSNNCKISTIIINNSTDPSTNSTIGTCTNGTCTNGTINTCTSVTCTLSTGNTCTTGDPSTMCTMYPSTRYTLYLRTGCNPVHVYIGTTVP